MEEKKWLNRRLIKLHSNFPSRVKIEHFIGWPQIGWMPNILVGQIAELWLTAKHNIKHPFVLF